MPFIYSLDNQITHAINSLLPHNQFFTFFFSSFSQRDYSILIWVAFLIVLIIFFEEHRNKYFVLYFVITFVLALLISTALKEIIQRPRPCLMSPSCPADYSFPSGHATAAFASAVIFSHFDKKRKYFYYVLATLVGISRIYLGVHYFFDVIVGSLIGTAISFFLLFSLRKISDL